MEDPCDSRMSLEDDSQIRASAVVRSVARTVFFGVNFAGGILFFYAAIRGIILPFIEPLREVGPPGGLLGSILLLPPSAAFAFAEWVAFYRNNRSVERGLGRVMFGLAAFTVLLTAATVFVAISEGGRALSPQDKPVSAMSTGFVVKSCALGAAIAIYFGSCGLFRLRRS